MLTLSIKYGDYQIIKNMVFQWLYVTKCVTQLCIWALYNLNNICFLHDSNLEFIDQGFKTTITVVTDCFTCEMGFLAMNTVYNT